MFKTLARQFLNKEIRYVMLVNLKQGFGKLCRSYKCSNELSTVGLIFFQFRAVYMGKGVGTRLYGNASPGSWEQFKSNNGQIDHKTIIKNALSLIMSYIFT